MGKLSLRGRRHGIVVASLVLTGALAAGGATAYAASTSTSPTPTPAPSATATAAPKAGHLAGRRLVRAGIHGQITVKNRTSGQYVTREWQRGQVSAVSGTMVTVKSADGTTWTWTTAGTTRVTRDGKTITESTLQSGDKVLVVGKQAGTANDATRIFAPSATQTQTPAQTPAQTPTTG